MRLPLLIAALNVAHVLCIIPQHGMFYGCSVEKTNAVATALGRIHEMTQLVLTTPNNPYWDVYFGGCDPKAVGTAFEQLDQFTMDAPYKLWDITCDADEEDKWNEQCKQRGTFLYSDPAPPGGFRHITLCANFFRSLDTDVCMDPSTLAAETQLYAQDFLFMRELALILQVGPGTGAAIGEGLAGVDPDSLVDDEEGEQERELPCRTVGCVMGNARRNREKPGSEVQNQWLASAYSYYGVATRSLTNQCKVLSNTASFEEPPPKDQKPES
ncbi:MAG: hypothetical protein M1833_005399 [Piccolia ochrophora]|nr:MAG: hypothetical protein M1833_005399 [Piccolia ochrophora]